ncbi:multicopper oxidase-domain-containing protein [Apodospora peruviana]|uniref:Multicopper oxidase-domain-containing protein n=1 Tax=Apodospora peruviana TaxID=516989 RepID=A0AAE0HUP7_9PEZI|nr:multicopper oxidase-domain-containing protein [Apodospora peruviana]
MKLSLFSLLTAIAVGVDAFSLPHRELLPALQTRQSGACQHTADHRECWGEHSIDTNFYDVIPAGKQVEYWLDIRQGTCAPDGVQRTCMTVNGTIPGPTIIADWGDELIIHVTNNMQDNGTAIHWHGLRMLNNMAADGVPGVTQCPIAPGQSMTYKFKVTQYGTTWYHSHFSLQYAEGLYGGMIFNGPATANYTQDMGIITLGDWGHTEAFKLWRTSAITGRPPTMDNSLINGTNTYTCTAAEKAQGKKCDTLINGKPAKKLEMVFKKGETYRLRLVNAATDAVFQFSIDGHKLKVIAMDLVPIKPFETDSIKIQMGQRYDVLVTALDQTDGNFWLRGDLLSCAGPNNFKANGTGIVRYDAGNTDLPTTNRGPALSANCLDEPATADRLVPYLSLDVTNFHIEDSFLEGLKSNRTNKVIDGVTVNAFQWFLNESSLWLNWSEPTLDVILNNKNIFPTPYNVRPVGPKGSEPEWAVMIIQSRNDIAGNTQLDHPIHLHGHDFWVLASKAGNFTLGDEQSFNTRNPVRRDVATLPARGYLAIAFLLDNPGAWLAHCHIAWHASQGLSLEFVESQDSIKPSDADSKQFRDTCDAWRKKEPSLPWHQEDSGI